MRQFHTRLRVSDTIVRGQISYYGAGSRSEEVVLPAGFRVGLEI